MRNRVDELKSVVSKEVADLIESAYMECEKMKAQAHSSGLAKDILAFRKRQASLEKLLDDLAEENGLICFKSITKVYEYLKGLGYLIAERTLYEHKKQGKLLESDKGYRRYDVDLYASKYLQKKVFVDITNSGEDTILSYAEQKAQAETEYKKIKTEKERLAIDEAMGRLISREVVAREFAGRIELIKRYLEDLVSSVPPILEGKTEREIRDILKDKINYVFMQYSAELELLK